MYLDTAACDTGRVISINIKRSKNALTRTEHKFVTISV